MKRYAKVFLCFALVLPAMAGIVQNSQSKGVPIDENLSVLISDIHLQMNPKLAYAFTAGEFPKRVKEILGAGEGLALTIQLNDTGAAVL